MANFKLECKVWWTDKVNGAVTTSNETVLVAALNAERATKFAQDKVKRIYEHFQARVHVEVTKIAMV